MTKGITISLVANLVSFFASIGINFVLSPYIVAHLGTDAVGYVPLLNNLVDIVNIVVISINSMAGRFIAIARHSGDIDKANRYAAAVFYSNVIMAVLIVAVAGIAYLNLSKLFDISEYMLSDVKTAFVFIAFNYVIHIVFSVFSVAPFVENRVDITARINIVYLVVRAAGIFIFFALFAPHIWYISAATIIATCVKAVIDARYSKKLMPGMSIKKSHFSVKYVRELLSSGLWNSVNKLGYKLFGSLDLLLANVYISAYSMGCVSISKTIPNTVSTLITAIVAVFLPTIVKDYAKSNMQSLKRNVAMGNAAVCLILAPVLSFILVFGKEFYALWMPSENSVLLQQLSLLAIFPLYITISCKTMPNIFQTTNNLKIPTMITLVSSVACLGTVLLLLRYTELGVYAIAGTSSVFIVLREIVFEPIYAGKCVGERWYFFYPQILKGILASVISCLLVYLLKNFISADSWLMLIIACAVTALFSMTVTFLVALTKNERNVVVSMLKSCAAAFSKQLK